MIPETNSLEPKPNILMAEEGKALGSNSDSASASIIQVQEDLAPEITLTAHIRETTWLKIFIDNQDPKEYIFQPNEHHQWKATKGFELLIGNAGGLDLELNGEAINSVGTPGQVVHLRLPNGYERRISQE